MKKLLALLFLIVIIAGSVSAIKVATYNVQSGVGIVEADFLDKLKLYRYFFPQGDEYLGRTSEFVNQEDIDIISITELDQGSFKTFWRDQSKILGSRLEIKNSVFFNAYSILGVVNQGSAIYSKYPIVSSGTYRFSDGFRKRHLGIAEVEIDLRTINLMSVHLSLDEERRTDQVLEILEISDNLENPIIIAGDFNFADESEFEIFENSKLKPVLIENTWPSWNPKEPNDAILISKDFEVLDVEIKNPRASDHLALIAELDFN